MEKINVAELLRDCPKGMELDCTMFENPVRFMELTKSEIYMITIMTSCGTPFYLTKEGSLHNMADAKCVIFPRGKTTWEGFVSPYEFKDGDILVGKANQPFIFQSFNQNGGCISYCGIDVYKKFWLHSDDWASANSLRFATEEEKEKLFQAIKDNGFRWNACAKILEKLVKPKFDITTLKPFDKVLVRDSNTQEWTISFFSHCNRLEFYKYSCLNGNGYAQCIPYEGNEYLLGKTDECNDNYKNWKEQV